MSNSELNLPSKWVLDPSHSELSFSVKHLMISNVKGGFSKFSAEIDGDDFTTSPIFLSIDALSISTNDANRDAHLRAPDFLDTEIHKDITFKSSALEKVDGDHYKLKGQLTIKGIAHPITLDLEYGGKNKDPWGNEKIAFAVQGKISRKEWGLNWNATLESGGVLVSDEVKINAEVQLVKQA